MNPYLQAVLALIIVIVVYLCLSSFLKDRYHTRKAIELGCSPAHKRHHRYPLGIDLVKSMMKADREQLLPDHFIDIYRHELGGRTTWQQPFLGTTAVFTVDSKNIQAILAQKFHDFDLGSLRRKNFFPMMGNGIFTVDGKAW